MAFSFDRLRAGLGNVRNALLPIPEEVASQLDPRTLEALRKQAVLQMGLGMMGASEKGAGLGTGALFGLNQAQQGLGQGVNQAWMGQRAAREDKRVEQQDRKIDAQIAYQQARDEETRRWRDEQAKMDRAKFLADEEYRRASLGNMGADNARAAEALALTKAEKEAELARSKRIDRLIQSQNKHLAKGGRRGDPAWQTYQDAIDNLSGRATDRGLDSGLGQFPGLDPLPPAAAPAPRIAPPAAIEALRKDPSKADQFKAKYGYLPF